MISTPKISHRALAAQPFHAMSIGARARELHRQGIDVAKLSLGEPLLRRTARSARGDA